MTGRTGAPSPEPASSSRVVVLLRLTCKNRYSTRRTVFDEIAMRRLDDCVADVCVIVKPCAFGAPLRGCGA